MPQLFANRAKSTLQNTITNTSTSIIVGAGDADSFPVANTETNAINTPGQDWFKIALIDTSGSYEIAYVRTRTLGSSTLSNVIRGQDGTTAIGFAAQSFVVNDFVADDLNSLLATQAAQAATQTSQGATQSAQAAQIADRVTKAEIQNNTYTAFTTAGTGSAYTLNAVPDAPTYAAGQAFDVTFHAASTGTPTIAVDAQSAKSLMYMNSVGTKVTVGTLIPANWRSKIVYDGTDFIVQPMPAELSTFLRNIHNGFVMSTAGASTTMTIGAGQCADSTNAVLIDLAASINKTTGAWAVGTGNGGLDTGSAGSSCFGATCSYATSVMTCTVAPSSGTFQVGQLVTGAGLPSGTFISSLGTGTGGTGTYNLSTTPGTIAAQATKGLMWLHHHVIRRADTGVVDVLMSRSATAPTMPANYTHRRWVGAGLLDASGNFTRFFQHDDNIVWEASVQEFTGYTVPTTRIAVSVTVPPSVRTTVNIGVGVNSASGGSHVVASDLDTTSLIAAVSTGAPIAGSAGSTGISQYSGRGTFRTNSGAQIGLISAGGPTAGMYVFGYNIAEAKGRNG